MRSRRKSSPARFLVALLVAGAVHVTVAALLVMYGAFSLFDPKPAAAVALPSVPAADGGDGDPRPIGIQTLGEALRRPGAPGERTGSVWPRLGEGGMPGTRGVPHPNLRPTPEMLARAIGKGAGSPDYLRDIDDGESTALNAKKFKYASFFNRVKRAV